MITFESSILKRLVRVGVTWSVQEKAIPQGSPSGGCNDRLALQISRRFLKEAAYS